MFQRSICLPTSGGPLGEIFRRGVATAHHGGLFLVELQVRENCKSPLNNLNENDAATMTNQIHRVIHRMLIPVASITFAPANRQTGRAAAHQIFSGWVDNRESWAETTWSRRAGLVSATTTCVPSAFGIAAAPEAKSDQRRPPAPAHPTPPPPGVPRRADGMAQSAPPAGQSPAHPAGSGSPERTNIH